MADNDHDALVKAWLGRLPDDLPPEALLARFREAWNALTSRAEGAVGEVALGAISETVRAKCVEKFPVLGSLHLESARVGGSALEAPQRLDPRELREAFAFMLVDLLTVVGDLTDQVLTKGLHVELSGAAPDAAARTQPEPRDAAPPQGAAPMTNLTKDRRLTTGVPDLDEILDGGFLKGASIAIAGIPGSGKTILAQQICFHNAAPRNQVLYFTTLSEPGAKTLFYLNKFKFFDPATFEESMHFVDLGLLLRTNGLPQTLELILDHVKKIKPAIVVIDSFKVFQDLTPSKEELRKFSYELMINLMALKATTFLLGEYGVKEIESNPIFSIIDGLITMSQRESSGEQQRFIQVKKLRGTAHSQFEHAFRIDENGIGIFAPRILPKRVDPAGKEAQGTSGHCLTGIHKLDELLGEGVPRGSSLLISGAAGTGKTVLGLEFIVRGAQAGEKGVLFSFEETPERLRAAAGGIGFDLDAELARGMLKIVFIPQPNIRVEHDLEMMTATIAELGARRVVIDSLSVFLHKIEDAQAVRDKVFHIAALIQNAGAVGFLSTDVPYGADRISRFGVEETVVDGVIILSSLEEGLERQRYIEVYKLRNTAHLKGRHTMTIGKGGITVFPRYAVFEHGLFLAPPPKAAERLSCGIPGLDKLLGDGLLEQSTTLVSGSSGIGKSTLALQFILEGARQGEPGLIVTLEEAPEEILVNADALDLPLRQAVKDGLVELVYLPPTHIRSSQFLSVLTDKVRTRKARRLVLDSTTHIATSGMRPDDVRELLYELIVTFRALGVTSVFTLESDSLYSMDFNADDRGFSPLADNIVVLRYAPQDSRMASSLRVIKTRGSTHDNALHTFKIARGGFSIGPALSLPGAKAPLEPALAARGRHR
ncbi:MAG: ATPase domain-containing protein [Elusimicrobiota bacterium]|nr:ATPase domain-containing protein [Elusimicrobiota bacterium]